MNNVQTQKFLTVASLIVAVILLMASTYMFLFQKTKGIMSTLKAALVPLFLLANAVLNAAITINNLKMNSPDDDSTPATA